MHIALATLYDPRDPGRGSGTYFFLGRELECQGHRVETIGPVDWSHPPLPSRLLKKLALTLGKRYRSFQDVFVARRIGAWVSERLRSTEADVLLTNDYAIAGYSRCRCPIALYTDAVFPRRYREVQHPWLRDLFFANVLSCQHVTRRGLERAALWCYPSDWAIATALDYAVEESASRVRRIEFGCNLFETPPAAVGEGRTFAAIERRGYLRVLFVGNRDWQLKGGGIAVAVVSELRRRGLEVRLDLVGARPPESLVESWARVHGEIDKVTNHQQLDGLYTDCDVLLVPTRAEGFGIVFAEAAAYGMPSLSFDSGTGVNNAIRHGESGLLLPLDSTPAELADQIHHWYDDPSLYDRLAVGARRFHDDVVNWPHAVRRLIEAIDECLAAAGRSTATR